MAVTRTIGQQSKQTPHESEPAGARARRWVLVGDAGYHKDPVTAQGISDAFRDAEAMASTLDDVFAGRAAFTAALVDYQRARDAAALPMFELTSQFASLEEPPPPEMQQLLAAIHGNDEAMSGYGPQGVAHR